MYAGPISDPLLRNNSTRGNMSKQDKFHHRAMRTTTDGKTWRVFTGSSHAASYSGTIFQN